MTDAVTAHHAQGVSRRGVLTGAASLAAVGSLADTVPSAFAASPPLSIENEEDLERALPALSNWGRWGPTIRSEPSTS